MEKIIFLVALILISGCEVKAVTSEKINNITVEFLFEKDGTRVYRFYDGDIYRYFTSRGETISEHRIGKGTRVEDCVN
jgi:hypothetical protein